MNLSDFNSQVNIRPFDGAFAVTPADSDLSIRTRGIYVGSTSGGSALKLTMINGDVVTLAGVMAGVVYPFQVKRIWSTDTTASSIIGFY